MKKIKNKAEAYSSKLIRDLFSESSSEELERTRKKMLLAARIDEAIRAKGWKKKDLATRLNKRPSEISKWLGGTHNFTVDTLWNLEKVLGIELINISGQKQEQVANFYLTVSQSTEDKPSESIILDDIDKLIPYLSTNYQL
ncbi:MAG: helix-turn-helix domain-containing protein [Bacteroidales bacterium]|nr:helix-turn-helix domain-containing protein [Bacteroidales bacterium]